MRNSDEYNYDRSILKRKRRRRRRIKRICVTIILIVLALVILVSVLRIKTLRMFRGDYVRRIDLTDQIAANAAVWLKDVEGADIDTDWVLDKTEGIYAKAVLNFDPDGLTKGSYTETLTEDSYKECDDEAYRVTGECLRELIITRLTAIGYADSMSTEEADALITEALGMPLDQYIREAGVEIMPAYNDLAEGINRSGDYRIRRKSIEWMRDGAESVDEFSVASDTITIPDAGLIYVRSEDEAENKGKE